MYQPLFVRVMGLLLFAVGLAGFSLPFWFNSLIKDSSAIELPLSMVSDAAVSPDGRVFVGIEPFGRIQIYSRDGRFLRSFSVDFPSGAVCLDALDAPAMPIEDRRVHTDEVIVDGLRVREFWPSRRFHCRVDPPVRAVTWWPGAVVIDFADGRPPLRLARAWWHYLVPGFLWSFLIMNLGIVLWRRWSGA
jgi:hypothetical protein